MKGYISDQITGLTYEEARANFEAAELLLTAIGIEPVNPMKNGLPYDADWKQHMVRDIELLMDCDIILMGERWRESKGARIEKYIAEEMGLTVVFTTRIERQNKEIEFIKAAIEEATGLQFGQYITRSRERNLYYARMIFAQLCASNCEEITVDDIAVMVNRPAGTIMRYMNNFEREVKYNRSFRGIVKSVKNNLSTKVSE